MFELFACIAVASLIFGAIFYQNFAEKHRARRMTRLIRRRREQAVEPSVPPSADS